MTGRGAGTGTFVNRPAVTGLLHSPSADVLSWDEYCRHRLAYHEAGHVLDWLIARGTIHKATIVPAGDAAGYVLPAPTSALDGGPDPAPHTAAHARVFATVYLAGAAGEAVLLATRAMVGSEREWQKAREALGYHYGVTTRGMVLRDIWLALVDRFSRPVERAALNALAAALLERGTLDGEEAYTITIAVMRAKRNELDAARVAGAA